jgi:peptidyl-lysine (3S)-dioxygenase / protease
MEYTPLSHFPDLEQDIWIGDGQTIGKLHFDEYDNFLVQVSGSKEILLFDPHHNENLYEGHIAEAHFSFNIDTETFSKDHLLESTSMVMIDLSNPDYNKFPRFRNTQSLKYRIEPGDILYLPSFWWHEVPSFSFKDSLNRNIAVNFWYWRWNFPVRRADCICLPNLGKGPVQINAHSQEIQVTGNR